MKTGAADVMDLRDIRPVLAHFAINLHNMKVADVGCGTGRLSQTCRDYYGYDISPSMVAYAKQNGVRAALVGDLADLTGADIVCCLSVFTHIHRADRQAYLARFRQLAPQLLVDILPGAEGGHPGVWYADRDNFEHDLESVGYTIVGSYPQTSPDGANHLYYHARQ